MSRTFYITLCLAVPPVWGLLSYWLFDLIVSRRKRAAAARQPVGAAEDKCDRD